MKLISDLAEIKKEFGFDPITNLLVTNIRMDDYKTVTPLILELDGKRYLVAREQETGNLAALGVPTERILFYDFYFSFNNLMKGSKSAKNIVEAIKNVTDNQKLSIGNDLPYSRYLQVKDAFDVEVGDPLSDQRVAVHKFTRAEVEERFKVLRKNGPEVATRVLKSRPHLVGLIDELETGADSRFSDLDETLANAGVESALISAGPNQSELIGYTPVIGRVVVYNKGKDEHYLVRPIDDYLVEGGTIVGTYDSYEDAYADLAVSKNVLIEDGWLTVGQAQRLEAAGFSLVAGSKALSKWREFRDHEDLSFQLIAAQASRYTIEASFEWAKEQLANGEKITELDVYKYALGAIADYRREYDIPFTIEPFFVNCHSAHRTVYPSNPVDFVIDENTNTLKFDAGLKVKVEGVILGTSDIGRTLPLNEVAKETVDLFMGIVRNDIIANIRPGIACDEIHANTVAKIVENYDRLIEIGIAPDLSTVGKTFAEEYGRRNVGHYMGKQESFATEFRPGHTHKVQQGSVGAVEIQWPFNGYGIAAEDLLFVGKNQTWATSS